MNLGTFIDTHKSHAISTQYCPVGDGRTSIICFYNFYERVFPDLNPDVDLHLVFLNNQGEEKAHITERIPGGGFVQLDASSYLDSNNGMVCIAAVPTCDIRELAPKGMSIKKILGTGFYIVWQNDNGYTDFMHEWMPINSIGSKNESYFVTIDKSKYIDRHELVLMNSCYSDTETRIAEPVIGIFNKKTTLFEFEAEPVAMMGVSVVDLHKNVPQLDQLLDKYEVLSVKVTSKYIFPPLTNEIHHSGDFHMHHID